MTSRFWMSLLAAAASVGIVAVSAEERPGPVFVEAHTFATLPEGIRFPEGIAANPASGDVFVGTFDFGPNANKLLRITRSGRIAAVKDFGATPLLGLGYAGGKVYILNFGASKVQRVSALFSPASVVEDVATIPSIGSPGSRTVGNPDGSSDTITFGSNSFPAPNAMAFDAAGNLYVSDSFQGAIFRIDDVASCATPCPVTTVLHDPMLATAGFPPFGANGLAFGEGGDTLFVAVTGDHRVLKVDLSATPPAVSVFAESLHGADGLLFENGRLWVAANQADEVVALDASGRPRIRAGFFEGLRRDGSPRGLLFPASLAVADGWMYVANLALPLTPAAGDEPEEDVTRWTIARLRLPRF